MPSLQVEKWHKEHGPIIHLNMGTAHWVFINNPQIAHEVLVKKGAVTSERHNHKFAYNMYSKNGSGIVFNRTGKKWKNSRNIGGLEQSIDSSLETLKEESQKNEPVCLLPYLELITYGVIIKAVFGKDVASIDDPLLKKFIYISRGVMEHSGPKGNIASVLPGFSWISRLTSVEKDMHAVVNIRDVSVKELLNDAVSGETDCLHATDLIVGAGDTTASLLLWLFAILAEYQDVQKIICAEIDTFMMKHGRIPSFSDRLDLPYTEAALLESARFRCVSNFGVPHCVTEDGNMYAMHMNPDVYENPHKFMPERFFGRTNSWNTSSNGSIKDRDIYMFGWGRRICPGIHLTEIEVFTVCIRFLARCSIEPPIGKDGKPETIDLHELLGGGITFTPKEYKVMFIPRNDSLPI
ncbi:cytochrome P450 [Phycomyces blakesleeanus]